MKRTRGAGQPPRQQSHFECCPFCGGRVGYILSHDGYLVACDACDIYGPRGTDYQDARLKWNRRKSNATKT